MHLKIQHIKMHNEAILFNILYIQSLKSIFFYGIGGKLADVLPEYYKNVRKNR